MSRDLLREVLEQPCDGFGARVVVPFELLRAEVRGAPDPRAQDRGGVIGALARRGRGLGKAVVERLERGGRGHPPWCGRRFARRRFPACGPAPAFSALRIGSPLDAPSPAAAKNIASNTPEDPPMVWLSSRPIARQSWVWSASGRRSIASIRARAAVARVEPVSPSPDFESSALRSVSAAISTLQQSVKNAWVASCSEGSGAIGVRPSDSAWVVTGAIALMPGQAASGVAVDNNSISWVSAGYREMDTPFMSSEVIIAAGPMTCAMRAPIGDWMSS